MANPVDNRSHAVNGPVAFVGDAHLADDTIPVEAFCEFLGKLNQRYRTIVFMGDLFDLWIGDKACQRAYHRQIIGQLTKLKKTQTELHYIEGNRDYKIEQVPGNPFHFVHSDHCLLEWEGSTLAAAHGDLVNKEDKQYRRWRRLSRSRWVWWIFKAIPRSRRVRWAESMERKMRSTNQEFKQDIPLNKIESYASQWLPGQAFGLVLGHFHIERALQSEHGKIWIVPEWKASQKFLAWDGAEQVRFMHWKEL